MSTRQIVPLAMLTCLATGAWATIHVPTGSPTIQAAINAAAIGETIIVAAGTYAEEINLNKVVTIQGANAGVAAGALPGSRGTETLIDGGFIVSAAATLDGLAISNGRSSGSFKVGVAVATSGVTIANTIIQNVGMSPVVSQSDGISTQPGNNGLTVTNSTIQNNWRGIYLNPGIGHSFVGNLIDSNNGVGVGIGSDGQSNLTFVGNVISNNSLEGWGASAVGASVTASDNTFSNNGVSVAHYGGSPIDASPNYWGAAPDFNQLVSGAVTYDPWWSDAAMTTLDSNMPVVNITDIPNTYYATIQAAIDAANPGDVLQLAAQTFAPTSQVHVDRPLTIVGAGSGATTIDVGGYNAWGIFVGASDVTLQGFTVQGNAVTNQQYGVHADPGIENLVYTDIVVQGTHRTAMDLNGVDGAVLTDITVSGAAAGFGFAISSSRDIVVTNLTSTGNAWGAVGIFPENPPYQLPGLEEPTDITFAGTINLDGGNGVIAVQDGPLESGGVWSGTISNDPLDGADVTVPASFGHIVHSTRVQDNLVGHYSGPQTAVNALAVAMVNMVAPPFSFSGVSVENLDAALFEVFPPLTIQAAIDAATPGGEVVVAAGTYPEMLSITKSLNLHGLPGQAATTLVQAPATLPIASDPLSNIVLVSGAGVSAEIFGLTIQGPGPSSCGSMGRGIFVRDGAYANIHDNQILDVRDNAVPLSGCQNGIAIQVGRQAFGTSGTATIANNLVQGHQKGGIVVDNTGSSATITGNTITGAGTISITAQNGIQISRGADATLANNTVSGHSYHLDGSLWDWGACGILLYQSGSVILAGGNVLTNNDSHYYAYAGVTGTLSLGAEVFGSSPAPVNSGYYVATEEPQDLDLTACTFEGIMPATATLPQLFAIESRIWHGVDEAGLGLARVLAGQLFVASDGTIQTAVDAADPGDKVNVAAGTFDEDVTVNKTLHVQGAGAGLSTVRGPIGGGGSTFRLDANNVELDGFSITRLGNNPTDWNIAGLNSAGISIQGAFTGANIHHNTISGNRTGIDINNSSGHTVQHNAIDDNRTGMLMRNQTDNLLVTDNSIANNWTMGVLFLDASGGTNNPLQQALSSSFSNNNLSGNWYGQVVERQSGGSLPLPGTTNLKSFPNNWWGTPAPVVSTANSTEPAYSSQIPVAYGGTATAPGGQPDILGPASANIQYLPALTFWGTPTVTILQAADQPLISVDDNGAPYPATTRLTVSASAATTPWRGISVEVVYDTDYLSFDPLTGFTGLFDHPTEFEVLDVSEDTPGHLLLDVTITGGLDAHWSEATDLFRVTFDAIAQPASPFTTPLQLGTVLVRDVLNNPLSYDLDADETITIDGTAPGTLTAVRAPAGALITANPTWTVTAADNYLLGKVEQKVDLGAWTLLADAIEQASWSGPAGPYGLADGQHTVSFQTRDKAGNPTGPLADTFTLDTTPPSLFEFVSQPANCVNSQPTWTLHGVDNILLGSIWMTINGGTANQVATMNAADWTGVVGPFGFADGSYTVVFTLKDTAGHTCATTLTDAFTLDTNAPTAPSGLDAVPAPNACILTWTPGDEMTGYRLYWKKRAGYPYPNGLQSYSAWDGDTLTADGHVDFGLVNTYPFTTANDFDSRGVYDFRLAATDCVNNPALGGMTSATNYYLGDVWQPYDGKVFTPDLVNVMSLVYGTVPSTNPGMEMNVGPTHDHSSYGLPAWGVTNARVNFEDLIIFSMNYGINGPTLPISSFGVTGTPVVMLHTTETGAQLTLDGQLKGFSCRIHCEATLLSAVAADFPVFFYRDGDAWVVDAVSLGGNLVDGSTIQLGFDTATSPELLSVDGRDAGNRSVMVDIVNGGVLPNSYTLEQNFPNPFNPVTTIRYALPEAASVKLAVYNALGQEVMTLVDGVREAGFHEARLDGSALASGVYIYRLEAGSFTDHKKLVLVK